MNVKYAPVAQLDRVNGYEPLGRGFESLQAHHTVAKRTLLRFLFKNLHILYYFFFLRKTADFESLGVIG